jgi:hypothetical protein
MKFNLLLFNIIKTETLAQFGSIFMLFGHGLIYSQHYRAPFKDKNNHDNADIVAMQNDTVRETEREIESLILLLVVKCLNTNPSLALSLLFIVLI